jgi:NADH dehydrogenase [ubiquinone] 1 alpha subcomplex assembly factor 1
LIPLHHESNFTFRFGEGRIIPRFHLDGVVVGRGVSVFRLDPRTGERLDLLRTATVGEGGWVDLAEPIMVRAGEGFLVVPDDARQVLFDFTTADATSAWQTVNDGVMGGVSEGKFTITDHGTLRFFGRLSLENNGGFASVRSRVKKLGLAKGDAVVVRLRGDGRVYSLNLYLDKPRMAFSDRAAFLTKKDEWIEVKVPLDQFEATSFGRVVMGAGPVTPGEINSVGFMLSDKQAGAFHLEVEWIRLERSAD